VTSDRSAVPAAGALPWRRRRGRLEVALVHRPRYDDWSWAKGKLDPGEPWPVAASRETEEETGLKVRLGRPLPTARYGVFDRAGRRSEKVVRYWAAEVVGGDGKLVDEVDEMAWLDVQAAHDRLDYARDRDQLRALVRADRAGVLATWSLVLVRHAKARPRDSWKRDDQLRPLDARGRRRARALVPVLAAYGTTRLLSSPSVRCTETLTPYAGEIGTQVRLKSGLSEEGYAEDPTRAVRHLRRLIERGTAAAVCSHGPVLPDLIEVLSALVDPESPDATDASAALKTGATEGMGKGEALVAHLVGTGPDARVVAVEREGP
jgi:phosphohistidine phosphatase SixA/8-oxo-dGTP pyrophosphatase MutT (NUDIX family)